MNRDIKANLITLILILFHACSSTTVITPVGNFVYEPNISPVVGVDSSGQELGVGISKSIVMISDDIYFNTDQNLKNLDLVSEQFLPEPPSPEDTELETMEGASTHFYDQPFNGHSIYIQQPDDIEEQEVYVPQRSQSLWKQKELTLLAMCVYGESRSEPYEGKLSIGFVVMNRLEEKSWYGKTLKEVLLKPYQFSCFNRNDPNYKKLFSPDKGLWKKCFKAAWNAYSKLSKDPTLGADHYCRYDISPPWINSMEKKKQIGDHVFFKFSPKVMLEWWYAHFPKGMEQIFIPFNEPLRREFNKIAYLIYEHELKNKGHEKRIKNQRRGIHSTSGY